MKEVKTNDLQQYIKDNNIKKDTIIFNTAKNIEGILYLENDYKHDELIVSIICSLVGFLDRIGIKAKCDIKNQIISDKGIIGNIKVDDKYVYFKLNIDTCNSLQTQIGVKTFINIYINLLQTNQYNKTLDYYQEILI